MDIALGEVIAERVLEKADSTDRVIVRIGRPAADPQGDWRCAYQIVGLGDDAVRAAFGVDGVQALQLCLQAVDAHVQGRGLTWLGDDDLGFFPIVNTVPPFDGEAGVIR